jgi:hypothetical protein
LEERKEYGKGEEEYSGSEEIVKILSVKKSEYTSPSVKVISYKKATPSSQYSQPSSLETESYSRKEINKYAPPKDRSECSPKLKKLGRKKNFLHAWCILEFQKMLWNISAKRES